MTKITSEAWVLYESSQESSSGRRETGELKRELFSFPDITEYEVLVEPLYGCWEANMAHAIERKPIDICKKRKEEKVVIGNAGVVRILKTGALVKSLQPDDLCIVFCNGEWDKYGYPERILAYDAPNTIGVLAKRIKLHEKQLIAIPKQTRHSLQQWAAFSLRYITAWANWKQAYGAWGLHFEESEKEEPGIYVWGWGGGVTLAQLKLAALCGCRTAMISSDEQRLELIERTGIEPIDRRQFMNLNFDEERYLSDPDFSKAYQKAEDKFLEIVNEYTHGRGVSIFVDYIGAPVFRATLKALARRGVITTAGWKMGMKTSSVRALECMNWHIHVHTHYARFQQGVAAMRFAEEKGWMPQLDGEEYDWDNIPQLARDYEKGGVSTYFPIFKVNPV